MVPIDRPGKIICVGLNYRDHAEEQGVDLIILGSRERHGLSILVNLTEDTVLHAAPCDVLAVRLR